MAVWRLTIAASLIAAPACLAAQEPAQGETETILVTGQRLQDTETALEACLTRDCPPEEDIAATLAHAENLFVAGEYTDARRTLRSGIGRNRQFRGDLPDAVAGLYRANSRVSRHLGNMRDYRFSTLEMRDILREEHGELSTRAIVAEVAVADSRLIAGYPKEAARIYRRAIERAERADQPRAAAYARLRHATILSLRAEARGGDRMDEAKAMLDELARGTDSETFDMALLAAAQLARIDRAAGNTSSTDSLIERYLGQSGVTYPLLLASEPIDMSRLDRRDAARITSSSTGVAQNNRQRWIDIGFLIGENGRVGDIELLRGDLDAGWPLLVTESVSSRRYAPLSSDDPELAGGLYRIERFTLTHAIDRHTGSGRGGERSIGPRIVRLDLTAD